MQMSHWTRVEGEGKVKLWHTMKNAPINEFKLYDFANHNGICSISHLAFSQFSISHLAFHMVVVALATQLAAWGMRHAARVVCEKCNNNWNLIATTTAPRSCHKSRRRHKKNMRMRLRRLWCCCSKGKGEGGSGGGGVVAAGTGAAAAGAGWKKKLIHFYYYIHRQAAKKNMKKMESKRQGEGGQRGRERERENEEEENAHVAKSPLAVALWKAALK